MVRAHVAAKEAGLKLIVGAEITPDDAPPVVLWATDRAAYGRLARLITRGRRRAEKGAVPPDVRRRRRARRRACWRESMQQIAQVRNVASADTSAVQLAIAPHSAFRIRSYRDLVRRPLLSAGRAAPRAGRPASGSSGCGELSRQTRRAAGGGRRRALSRARAAGRCSDVLTAIRHGCTVADGRRAAVSQCPAAPADRRRKWPRCSPTRPRPCAARVEIADRCTFSLDELRYEYPEELAPPGLTPMRISGPAGLGRGAAALSAAACPRRCGSLLEHELQLIEELHYEAYFLTVWDLVRFARRRGILCQGRGSAANSAVCYCLGITAVDPERMDVLFERFVSRERNEAPDIDVDFEHERREEVLQYLYRKYGRERAGMTAEVITYRPRSAVRDVGKALGLPPDRIDRLAKTHRAFPRRSRDLAAPLPRSGHRSRVDRRAGSLIELVGQLVGFPAAPLAAHRRHGHDPRAAVRTGADRKRRHARPHRHPVEQGRSRRAGHPQGRLPGAGHAHGHPQVFRPGRSGITAGELTLANIPEGDEDVYEMIRRADTMGVFQIESRAQMSMLPRLRPRCFYDLVIEVAIVRPGPIQGNMVHPYLRRRNGEEPVDVSQRGDPRRAGKDARRAAVPGAGDAAGGGGGRLHARRGRPASPRHGRLAAAGRDRPVPPAS